ncbi:hypothetical protein C0J52_27051 [Blattella germanica]|nr:hypothetical protein C0J52_27051 [Blattella germanica]
MTKSPRKSSKRLAQQIHATRRTCERALKSFLCLWLKILEDVVEKLHNSYCIDESLVTSGNG